MRGWLRQFAHTLGLWRANALRGYAPLAVLVLLYYLAARATVDSVGGQLSFDATGIFSNFQSVFVLVLVVAPFAGFIWLLVTDTGERPFRRIARLLRTTPWVEIALLRVLPMLVLFSVLQMVFLALKQNIPNLVPFHWDPLFIEIDRALFLGTDPWVITHALFDDPIETKVIDGVYGAWLPVMLVSYAAAAAMPLHSLARMTYVIAFFLNWAIVGSLFAIVFSSAGPVYMEPLFGDPTFAPLMERLARQDGLWEIFALNLQGILWKGYTQPEAPFYGISAFPSMHLCIATTITLFGFGFHRWIGWGLALFTGIILIGSVHLGWHYAIDGIAGIILALVLWQVSQRFARWWLGEVVPSADAAEESPSEPGLASVSPEKL